MDQELIAYLNSRFERIDRRFEAIDQRFKDTQGQIDRRFDKTEKKIGETTIVVEGLRSDIQAVAEGHEMLSRKIDRIYVELRTERQHDRDEHRATLKRITSASRRSPDRRTPR